MYTDVVFTRAIVRKMDYYPPRTLGNNKSDVLRLICMHGTNNGQFHQTSATMFGKPAETWANILKAGDIISFYAKAHFATGTVDGLDSGDTVTKMYLNISRIYTDKRDVPENPIWVYELLLKATCYGLRPRLQKGKKKIRLDKCPFCEENTMLRFSNDEGDGRPGLYACKCGYRRNTRKWQGTRLTD